MSRHDVELGKECEDRACELIGDEGFDILARNYRLHRIGEIDIIARRENLLVFFEVKGRETPLFGGALYSIGAKKRQRIRRIALSFLQSNPLLYSKDILCRFDMIAFENDEERWIEDIFR